MAMKGSAPGIGRKRQRLIVLPPIHTIIGGIGRVGIGLQWPPRLNWQEASIQRLGSTEDHSQCTQETIFYVFWRYPACMFICRSLSDPCHGAENEAGVTVRTNHHADAPPRGVGHPILAWVSGLGPSPLGENFPIASLYLAIGAQKKGRIIIDIGGRIALGKSDPDINAIGRCQLAHGRIRKSESSS